MTYGGPEFIKMIQKNNKITYIYIYMCWGGGGQDKPAWKDCPPGVKITRVGGARYPGTACPPGGQAVQGGKINCYTGLSNSLNQWTFMTCTGFYTKLNVRGSLGLNFEYDGGPIIEIGGPIFLYKLRILEGSTSFREGSVLSPGQ